MSRYVSVSKRPIGKACSQGTGASPTERSWGWGALRQPGKETQPLLGAGGTYLGQEALAVALAQHVFEGQLQIVLQPLHLALLLQPWAVWGQEQALNGELGGSTSAQG